MKSKAVHAARCRHLCHSSFGIGRKYLAVISNYILGVKPDWYGLKIDPCVPHDWDGYKVSRRFRSATYEIAINNPDHVCRGVKAVTVDGNVRRLFRLHL